MLDNNLQNDPLFLRTARFASDRNADYVRKLNFQQDTVDATIAVSFLARVSDHICARTDTKDFNSANFHSAISEVSNCRLAISEEYSKKWGVSILSPIYQTLRKYEDTE